MPFSDEELVQYLLGEADSALVERLQKHLASSARAVSRIAERLQELRAALGLLDSLQSVVQPPEDLVAKTMMRIDAAMDGQADADADPASEFDAEQEVDFEAQVQPSSRLGKVSSGLSPSAIRSPARVWDSAILTTSIIALSCLLLPVVLEARSQSRRLQCSHNLKTLGRDLTELAMLDPEHRFPSIPTQGPHAFAGYYSVRLADAGLLEKPEFLQCVSLRSSGDLGSRLICVPTTGEFLRAGEEQQRVWRSDLGGNYAYNLGVSESGRIAGPRLEGRSHFAVLSDAPFIEQDREVLKAHDGRGINIFYEDGHVGFLSLSRPTTEGLAVDNWREMADHPFRNDDGKHAAGLNPNDAALGPSNSSPLPIPVRLPTP